MKLSKLFAGAAISACAAAVLSTAVSAYDFGDKNLGKNWSINATVSASEFSELTEDSYVTVTFEADQSEEEYWSIKPMDSSWTFIDPNGVGGPELAEGKDAYPVQKEDTSITFKVPADFVESIQANGMIFIGHSVTLKTLTVSDEAPAAEAKPAEDTEDTENTEKPENTDSAASDKASPDTGVEDVAVFAGIALIAGAAALISRKRK